MLIHAILLAAGELTRMGRPKALLPWAGTTLIEYQVRELMAAGTRPVVVLGHDADEVRRCIAPEATVVVNEAYREGRASSLRAGAAALPGDTGPIVVLGVDQPRARHVLRRLLAAHLEGDALITTPVHDGRRGHPPVLSGTLLREIGEASEETLGLRGIIAAHQGAAQEVEIESAAIHIDVNTPEDYERALSEFAGASHSS